MTDAGLDELFAVKPKEFVAARDALAKNLRAQGRADEAKQVRQMRRPPAVVWVLNQLARREPEAVATLIGAGETVREAQRQGSGSRLRQAGDELQSVVSALARRGAELLVIEDVAGAPRTVELEAALRAAALGGDVEGNLRAGRLLEGPEGPSGAEMWVAAEVDEAEPPAASVERELEVASERHRRAEADLDRARGDVDRAARNVDALEQRLERARQALQEAGGDLEEAERRTAQAEEEVSRLRAELEGTWRP